jgi:hypothetical protein
MKTSAFKVLAPWLRFGLMLFCLGYASQSLAKSTGVGEDSALQSGPCYQALVDRNVAQPTTAPNRELGSACETEHGDVEKAWARVIRLWGSDSTDVPDYDSYRRADADDSGTPGLVWYGLGLVGMLLVYALCGTPMRSAARLMSGEGGLRNVVETLVGLLLRGIAGLILLWLCYLSFVTLIGSLGFAALIAMKLRASRTLPVATSASEPVATGGVAETIAEAVNDIAGALPGLVGLALLAHHDSRMLALAVALALLASIPFVILSRRRLRQTRLAETLVGAMLAADIGVFATLDPPISTFGGGSGLYAIVVPLLLAIAIAAWGWRGLTGSASGAVSSQG